MYTDLVLFEGEKFDLGFKNAYKIKVAKDPKDLKKEKLKIIECDEFNLQQMLERKIADIIIVNEKGTKEHLHFRRTALNQVTCRLAKKNDTIIAFSFDNILNAKNKALVFGRLMQSFRLCRKYKLKVLFASFARDKFGMRSSHDLLALLQVLGMTGMEAKKAMGMAEEIINRVPEVAKGVKIVKK